MQLSKTLCAALGLSLVGMAAAQAAQSTVSLNVRSGPSTNYRVVDVLYQGETVDVEGCQSGWCRINHTGPDGWVSARYLTNIDQRGGSQQSAEPDINFSVDVPGFSFSIGNGGDFRPRPGRPSGEVCFYEDYNYRGASFCAEPGQRNASLGSFNDRISSIRVRGDAQVQVCEDYNFDGRCAVLDRNRPSLQGRNNDIISSYRVR